MSDRNADHELRLLGAELEAGERLRTVCPYCLGGSTTESSLSIERSVDGALLYNCFRAKCGRKGAVASSGKVLKKGTGSAAPTPRNPTWDGEVMPMPDHIRDEVYERWGLEDPPNWYWTEDFGGRIAMSVRSPKDTHRGWILRSLNPDVRTKAYTYLGDQPKVSWYRKVSTLSPLVLVEDIPSAVRASKYVHSAALLGTGLGPGVAEEIRQYKTGDVFVALDNDATADAIRMARRNALLWGNVSVLPLVHDLKDLTEDELCETLSGL